MIRTFNALYIALIVFAAWAAYRLAYHVVGDRTSAFIAGVAFGFSPAVLSPLHSGTPTGGNAGWIALYLWFLVLPGTRQTMRHAVVAGCLLALVTYACWYYGAFCALATMLYMAFRLLQHRPQTIRKDLLRLGVLLGVAASLVIPLIALIKATLTHPDATHLGSREVFLSEACEHEIYSSTVGAFFNIFADRTVDGYAHLCYLGFGVLFLAAVGLVRRSRRSPPASQIFWGVLAIVFALISLGPVLWVWGRPILTLPYYYGMKWLPFVHYFEFPFRFTVVTSLALAMLAAWGLQSYLHGADSKRRAVIAAVAGTVILFEHMVALSWPLPVTDARTPLACDALAAAPGAGAVLDFPLGVETTGRFLYYQVAHRRPAVPGVSRLGSEPLEAIVAPEPGSDSWHWIVRDLGADQLAALRHFGIRFIVWHEGLDERGDALGRALKARGIATLYCDADCTVFDLWAPMARVQP